MKETMKKWLALSMACLVTLGASALRGGDTKNYLCFTANTAGSTIKLEKHNSPNNVTIEYSTDKFDWENVDFSAATETITLENAGDKVYFRNAAESITGFSTSGSNYYMFVMSGSIAASGNVMSLVDKSCESIEIPGQYCFYYLFKGCTALTTAPELPATTLKEYCYYRMFYNCSSLETAPELPATTLTNHCYQQMFYVNNNLNVAKVAFTSTSGLENPLQSWMQNVAPKGIFICPSNHEIATSSANGIPSGWSVNGYDLTVSAGWASMYLPIDVTIPEGVEVYYASSVSGSVVTLSPLAGAIPAGTGVIVKASESSVFFPYTSTAVTPVEGNLFEGNSTSKACNAGENYVLNASKSSDDNVHFSIYTGTTLNAFKAYLPMSAVGGASSIQFRFGDTTAITPAETEAAEDVIYNLAGQRVGSDYRGIVIKNGKKVFNK